MPEGTITKLVSERGFGFIGTDRGGRDLFFHLTAVEEVRFEELRVGQSVEYTEGRGLKGLHAENVKPV